MSARVPESQNLNQLRRSHLGTLGKNGLILNQVRFSNIFVKYSMWILKFSRILSIRLQTIQSHSGSTRRFYSLHVFAHHTGRAVLAFINARTASVSCFDVKQITVNIQ